MSPCHTKFILFYHILLFIVSYGQQNETNNATHRNATIGYGGMVGSAHHLATEAGLKILRDGGNAADAALAVQLTLNLVQPMMSGLGGGCFILYYDYENKTVYSIDGREEAPNAYHEKIFCKNPDCLYNVSCDCKFANETADYNEKRVGGLAVGVPGTLYAYYKLHQHFGTTDWEDLFQPAIDLSYDGFEMYQEMYSSLQSVSSFMRRFTASYELFYNTETGEPKAEIGELFYNEPFGELLEKLAEAPDLAIQYFYEGDIAEAIVDAVQNNVANWTYNDETVQRPGLMTMDDISGYRAVFREIVESSFGNDSMYKMYGMNMPSSGGATVQYLMNLMYSLMNDEQLSYLNGADIVNQDISTIDNVHYLITANNIAFSDRNQFMADSDFISVPVDGLIDFDYINSRAVQYFDENFVSTPIPFGAPDGSETNQNQTSMLDVEHGTSHFFVVDQWNNVATITTTIEGGWGSCITVPQYGFLLNNELTDFDALGITFDGVPVANGPMGGKQQRSTALDLFENEDGIIDSETFGGKRPRSSMSPSLVLDTDTMEPVLSVGSPGGSTIIATTFETMFNILLREWDVQQSIDAERIWSFNGADIRVDERVWKKNNNLRQQLIDRGYDLSIFRNASHGTCQAVKFIKSQHFCEKNENNFYLLYGGADDQRWSTANVASVCQSDGNGNVDTTSTFCAQQCIEISSLTDTQRVTLIVAWLIALITVLCVVINRDRIRKWKQKRQNRKRGYFAENDVNEQSDDKYIGDDTQM